VLCEKPPCIRSCSKDALRRSEKTAQIIVEEDRCIGCSWCVVACPFGAISFNRTEKVVTICDLCDGEPECVRACPYEALAFITPEEVTHKSKKEAFMKLLQEFNGMQNVWVHWKNP
jgi:Fe-S-cluster-containing hydrogenase component 2